MSRERNSRPREDTAIQGTVLGVETYSAKFFSRSGKQRGPAGGDRPREETGPLLRAPSLFYLNRPKVFSQSQKGLLASSAQTAQGVTESVRNGVPILFFRRLSCHCVGPTCECGRMGREGEKERSGSRRSREGAPLSGSEKPPGPRIRQRRRERAA